MNTVIPNVMTEHFATLFAKSQEVHACSYDAFQDLKPFPGFEEGTSRYILPLESKALRFFVYCQETNQTGKILTSDHKIDVYTTPAGAIGFASVTAEVYLNETLIGSAVAGQSFQIGNPSEMDCVLQTASGLAKSRALSNAGFGIISGTDADSSVGNAAENIPQGYPAVMSVPGTSFNQVTQTAQGAPVVPQSTSSAPQNPQATAFAQLGGQLDPLTVAKSTPYPLRGNYAGKPLGELPTKALEWFAGQSFQEPALCQCQKQTQLILADRRNEHQSLN